ncbi:MAG: EF-P lysine aminoacylase EpmA [Ectothiorhodospira sp.]
MNWRPGAPPALLRRRARLLADLRAFFARRGVLEVETPYLSAAGTTDPQVGSLSLALPGGRRFLHTSPEFPMKRLLAAGVGDCYQVARVFRADEVGRHHNPEFTLLEWYRTGLDHHHLMDEVEALVRAVDHEGRAGEACRLSYARALADQAGVDAHRDDARALARRARELGLAVQGELDRDAWLDLLLSMVVCPAFPPDRLTFLYDYPASQAALARVRPGDPPVAERFELYWGPLELANGFHELGDPAEQRRRFEAERTQRARRGLADVPMDTRLLEALEAGLPACAGVALGVDRLLMGLSGEDDIRRVLAFDAARA